MERQRLPRGPINDQGPDTSSCASRGRPTSQYSAVRQAFITCFTCPAARLPIHPTRQQHTRGAQPNDKALAISQLHDGAKPGGRRSLG